MGGEIVGAIRVFLTLTILTCDGGPGSPLGPLCCLYVGFLMKFGRCSLLLLAVQVAVCCFDKTGTLTSDNMVLKGLVGLAGRMRELVADVREGSRECARVLAACHSLIQVIYPPDEPF